MGLRGSARWAAAALVGACAPWLVASAPVLAQVTAPAAARVERADSAAKRLSAAEVDRLVESIRNAARRQPFAGTLVYSAGGDLGSARVQRSVPVAARGAVAAEPFERFESLDGRPQRVERLPRETRSIFPGRQLVIIEPRGAAEATTMGFAQFDARLRQSYDVIADGEDRVAGRPARVWRLQPHDALRYGQRWWVDAATGLLLRADTLALPEGRAVESIRFSELVPGEPAGKPVPTPLTGMKVVRAATVPAALEDSGWRYAAQRAPAGFQLVSCERRPIAQAADPPDADASLGAVRAASSAAAGSDSGQVLHAVLSDGVARVSVFIEPRTAAAGRTAQMTQAGATVTLSRPLGRDAWITVMGDVPAAGIKAIAAAVEPVG